MTSSTGSRPAVRRLDLILDEDLGGDAQARGAVLHHDPCRRSPTRHSFAQDFVVRRAQRSAEAGEVGLAHLGCQPLLDQQISKDVAEPLARCILIHGISSWREVDVASKLRPPTPAGMGFFGTRSVESLQIDRYTAVPVADRSRTRWGVALRYPLQIAGLLLESCEAQTSNSISGRLFFIFS